MIVKARAHAPWGAAIVLAAIASGCGPEGPGPVEPAAKPEPVDVVLLYTTDEHGWIEPYADKNKQKEGARTRGGAAEVLARWRRDEGHCPEARAVPRVPTPPKAGCKKTLAISGGDNFTGPAISSFHEGMPTAEVMAEMGYAASAFGNHELDFGRAAFDKGRAVSHVSYLAANLKPSTPDEATLVKPFEVYAWPGARVAIVGLATEETLTMAMASRFGGITFEAMEPALDRTVKSAWAEGVDAVVVVAHECAEKLVPIVAKHPEWRLSFVGGGHCHKGASLDAGGVPVIAPGWRFDRYVRIALRIDPARPANDRVVARKVDVIDTDRPEGSAPTGSEPAIDRIIAAYKAKLDRALGEEIGKANEEHDKDSAFVRRWVAGAIREETGADVAIVNAHGIRQSLPKGPITKATVWSVLPFDNKVILFTISGADLAKNLANKAAVADGVRDPIDPQKRYRAATLDFLFFGGDNFTFAKVASDVRETPIDWRTPVIEWTRKQRSTALEERLR